MRTLVIILLAAAPFSVGNGTNYRATLRTSSVEKIKQSVEHLPPANYRAVCKRAGGHLNCVLEWTWPDNPFGTCDSTEECEEWADEACDAAGHDGCDSDTVEVKDFDDGGSSCSCDCVSNGAVAITICHAS